MNQVSHYFDRMTHRQLSFGKHLRLGEPVIIFKILGENTC